jgi:hypothetical protein
LGDVYVSHNQILKGLEIWRRGLDRLDAPHAGRGPLPEVEFWKEDLREELLGKINSYVNNDDRY